MDGYLLVVVLFSSFRRTFETPLWFIRKYIAWNTIMWKFAFSIILSLSCEHFFKNKKHSNNISKSVKKSQKNCENLLLFFCVILWIVLLYRASVLCDDSSEHYVMYICMTGWLSFIYLSRSGFIGFPLSLSLLFSVLCRTCSMRERFTYICVWYDFWYTKTIKINVPKHKLIGFW